VSLARFTREDYAHGASRLPNREEKTTVLQSSER